MSASGSEPSDPTRDCVLAAGAEFEGLLCFRGAIRIDGTLVGDVVAHGSLWIGEHAALRGRVQVDELIVAGRLEGDVEASGRVELLATARVQGAVRTPRLVLAEGSTLDGLCSAGPGPVKRMSPSS